MRIRDTLRPPTGGVRRTGRLRRRGGPGAPAAQPVARGRSALIGAAWLVVACASAGPSGTGGPPPSTEVAPSPAPGSTALAPCPQEPASAGRPTELRVAAPGAVAPADVPAPRSAAERVAFRQMYATLVRADCAGQLRPGLADSWSLGAEGRSWTFHLGGKARFWDGTRVTAGDVVWSWRRLSESPRAARTADGSILGGSTLLDLPPALPDSVAAVDDTTLEAYFGDVAPPAAAFADPRLAVLRAGDGVWPLGSGPLRPATSTGIDTGADSGVDSVELVLRSAFGSGSTVVLVRGAPGDERDLLDAGVDVVVTSDPRTRRYAETLPDYVVLPEPWSRTYALAVPRTAPPDGAPGDDGTGPDQALAAVRASLARDAVRGEAAPAGPLAWRTVPSCASPAGPSAAASGQARWTTPRIPRLAYPLGDGPARDLADRLVALASAPAGSDPETAATAALLRAPPGLDWRTLPLVAGVLGLSARAAREAAYVVVLPRRVLDPCAARRALDVALPWLGRGGDLTPLVDTRPAVLVRRDVSGLAVDFDGTPRLERAGRRGGGGGSP